MVFNGGKQDDITVVVATLCVTYLYRPACAAVQPCLHECLENAASAP